MADVNKTFGVKVPEVLHVEATELMKKLDLSGEGFLNELINVYKSEKAKEDVPIIAEDLRDLQAVQQRISGIYLNMAYKIENINKASEQNKQEELTKRDLTISDLQYKNNELSNSVEVLEGVFNTACEDKNKLNDTVNQLTNSINDKNLIVDEYKLKNDTLTGILEEYKGYKIKIEENAKLLADSQAKNIDLSNDIKDKEFTISNLNKSNEQLIQTNNEAIRDLNIKHDSEIENLNDKLNIGKEKALLELQKSNQEQLIQEQSKHNLEIAEYQMKYKQLLHELEQSKKVVVKTKEPKTSK
ncbi:coiled-coil domain-containing protein [Clostridium tagluense]|uniref:hypothetical protein n=1 Tax=Clostridium tagluense TaxID=360422 RepID=UPI001CF23D05|nr:hypothetical protein [Clostridium tagluense]MCB2300429.1 hypothetical protein [Clostridium tagluense]